MDQIDRIRCRAKEENAPQSAWLNGVAIVVMPDGQVFRREYIDAYIRDKEGRLRLVTRDEDGRRTEHS